MPDDVLADILRRTVAGDLTHFDTILKAGHEDLRAAAVGGLLLERRGVLNVLHAWERGELADAQVQAWASFIRSGFLPSPEPIRPINVEYDPVWEELINEVLGRLDELGDEIDGTVSDKERASMIEALGK